MGTMSLLAPLDLLVLGTHCRSLRRGEAGEGEGGSGRRREGRGGWKRDGGVGEGMGVGSRYFFHYNQFFGSVRDAFILFYFYYNQLFLALQLQSCQVRRHSTSLTSTDDLGKVVVSHPAQESKQVYIKNGSCRISREVDGVAVDGSGVTIEYCPLYAVTDGVQPLSAWNFATVGRKTPSPTQPLTVIGKNPRLPFTPPGVFSPYCTTKSSCRWTPELLISKCKSTTVQSATSASFMTRP